MGSPTNYAALRRPPRRCPVAAPPPPRPACRGGLDRTALAPSAVRFQVTVLNALGLSGRLPPTAALPAAENTRLLRWMVRHAHARTHAWPSARTHLPRVGRLVPSALACVRACAMRPGRASPASRLTHVHICATTRPHPRRALPMAQSVPAFAFAFALAFALVAGGPGRGRQDRRAPLPPRWRRVGAASTQRRFRRGRLDRAERAARAHRAHHAAQDGTFWRTRGACSRRTGSGTG